MAPFLIGAPPEAPMQLRDPQRLMTFSPNMLGVYGFVGGLLAAIILIAATGVNPAIRAGVKELGLPIVFLVMLVTLVMHEGVHFLAYGGLRPATDVSFGFDKSTGFVYTYSPSPVSRGHFVMVILAPFVIMTLLPIFAFKFGLVTSPAWLVMGAMNSLGAGADLVLAWFALRTVPRGAFIQSSGMFEYWGTPTSVAKQPSVGA